MGIEEEEELFNFLKSGNNPFVKIETRNELFDLVMENVLVIGETTNVIKEHYKKEYNLKQRHTFDTSPIIREKVLDFIEKCYTGQAFFYEKIKTYTSDGEGEEIIIKCRDCGAELDPDNNYCWICKDFKEPITEDYKRRGNLSGEKIIETVGGDFDRYGMALSSQVTPMQDRISKKIINIGIDIEPKSVPSAIQSMKEAEPWVKRKYTQILLFDKEIQLNYMKEFNKTDIVKLQNELRDIILNDPKLFSESAHHLLSGKIKEALRKANVCDELYKKITLKLKHAPGGNLLSDKGFILDDINLAILDWSTNDISKSKLISKYNLSSKKGKLDLMLVKWIELGIITLPQRGIGGPRLNPEYSSLC